MQPMHYMGLYVHTVLPDKPGPVEKGRMIHMWIERLLITRVEGWDTCTSARGKVKQWIRGSRLGTVHGHRRYGYDKKASLMIRR